MKLFRKRADQMRTAAVAVVLALAAGLAGCEGVEVNGKLVNALGITGSGKAADPKVAERSGLIIPPTVGALPAPDAAAAPAQAALWPEDPDLKAARLETEKANAEAQQKCLDAEDGDDNSLMKQMKKNSKYETRKCGSIFGDLGKNVGADPPVEPVAKPLPVQ